MTKIGVIAMENQERPDGSTATGIGWALIALGVVAAFVTGGGELSGGRIFAFALANLGVGLGVLLLSLGYLVRAIWFLPGREVAQQCVSGGPNTPPSAYSTCDWCERVLPAGKTTCTSLSPSQLAKVAGQVKDPTCLRQFEQRGIRGKAQNG